ncbi:MAG: hypothetical protein QY318_02360 [Candidatus Dojkabacteria bacterium]|nr:MAG: hypothetical protein QY318_02360 [Candidatus Dojkabacteria bacterium]
MARLFDQYIAVDWSARSVPSPKRPTGDAIWIGVKSFDEPTEEQYFQTRYEAEEWIGSRLVSAAEEGIRTLIGYDFDFGFPAGFANAVGANNWLGVWELLNGLVEDNQDNSNNRFNVADYLNSICTVAEEATGPFWAIPRGTSYKYLSAKKDLTYPFITSSGVELSEKRLTELREPKSQPVWKLIGSASVGGQTILGIPMLHRLIFNEKLRVVSTIWPLETGFNAPSSDKLICHIEIWPGIFAGRFVGEAIRDQAQVRAIIEWFDELDQSGGLVKLLSRLDRLSDDEVAICVGEEGWIIGMGQRR